MTTTGTEQKWSHWAGDLIRDKMDGFLSRRALKSGLNGEGGPNKQWSYWAHLTLPFLVPLFILMSRCHGIILEKEPLNRQILCYHRIVHFCLWIHLVDIVFLDNVIT